MPIGARDRHVHNFLVPLFLTNSVNKRIVKDSCSLISQGGEKGALCRQSLR